MAASRESLAVACDRLEETGFGDEADVLRALVETRYPDNPPGSLVLDVTLRQRAGRGDTIILMQHVDPRISWSWRAQPGMEIIGPDYSLSGINCTANISPGVQWWPTPGIDLGEPWDDT